MNCEELFCFFLFLIATASPGSCKSNDSGRFSHFNGSAPYETSSGYLPQVLPAFLPAAK